MTVIELIEKLQTMPLNAEVHVTEGCLNGCLQAENISQEWDDYSENYVVVL